MNSGIRDFSGKRLKAKPSVALAQGFRMSTDVPTKRLTCSAQSVILRDARGHLVSLPWAFTVIDPAGKIGLSGIDQSGLNATTGWFYVWAISDGRRVSGLLSASRTNPRLPAGWFYRSLVAAIYCHTAPFVWRDTTVIGRRHFSAKVPVIPALPFPSEANWANLDSLGPSVVTIASVLPPNATYVYGVMGTQTTPTRPSQIALASQLSAAGATGRGIGYVVLVVSGNNAVPVGSLGFSTCGPFQLPVIVPQTLYGRGSTTEGTRVEIDGFEI